MNNKEIKGNKTRINISVRTRFHDLIRQMQLNDKIGQGLTKPQNIEVFYDRVLQAGFEKLQEKEAARFPKVEFRTA